MVHEAVIKAEASPSWGTPLLMDDPSDEGEPDVVGVDVLEGDGPISWKASDEFSPDDVMGILSEVGQGGTITMEDVE
jgi:hypothetical protein